MQLIYQPMALNATHSSLNMNEQSFLCNHEIVLQKANKSEKTIHKGNLSHQTKHLKVKWDQQTSCIEQYILETKIKSNDVGKKGYQLASLLRNSLPYDAIPLSIQSARVQESKCYNTKNNFKWTSSIKTRKLLYLSSV
jgi:methylmalonyl-CoA mutase N-terminal domain/subunit